MILIRSISYIIELPLTILRYSLRAATPTSNYLPVYYLAILLPIPLPQLYFYRLFHLLHLSDLPQNHLLTMDSIHTQVIMLLPEWS